MKNTFINQYIALLLLIAPGFICRSLHAYLHNGKKDEVGEKLIISSLLYSVWVLLLNFVILYCVFHIKTISRMLTRFNQNRFVISYIGITIVSCLVITLVFDLIHPKYTIFLLNKYRKLRGRTEIGRTSTVWDKLFQDEDNLAIIVEKDSNVISKGFIQSSSPSSNKEKELYLTRTEEIPEGAKIKGTYINLDNNLIIKILESKKKPK